MSGNLKSFETPITQNLTQRSRLIQFSAECAKGEESASFYSQKVR